MKFFALLRNRILFVLSIWASDVKVFQLRCQFPDQIKRFRGRGVLSPGLRLVAGDFVEYCRLLGGRWIVRRSGCDASDALLAESRRGVFVDVEELRYLVGYGYSRHEVKFPAA